MKMMKQFVLGFSLVILLMGCDTKEKARLHSTVDSLNTELKASREVADQMEEVYVLIDSIDASRHLLRVNIVEGTSYDNYANRLKNINRHIKETQAKIASLERKSKNSSSAMKRLKADLKSRLEEVAALQLEVSILRSENKTMAEAISKKDSTLMAREGMIKIKEADIAFLEARMRETDMETRLGTADMYFDQAMVWEKVASRTHFAPRKKKQAKREALDLYRISLSLGRADAQQKIDTLEKDLK